MSDEEQAVYEELLERSPTERRLATRIHRRHRPAESRRIPPARRGNAQTPADHRAEPRNAPKPEAE